MLKIVLKNILLLLFLLPTMLSGQNTKFISYNIRFDNPADSLNAWQHRKDFLISQLNFHAPDVFGTQEGLYHQLTDIKDGLPGYHFFGLGRDYGDTRGEHTAVFYNSATVKLLQQGTFWLSETPEKPSKGWDAALNRICTYGIFERIADGKKFMVFNTHFDHVGNTARLESAKLILKKIKELNTENFPVILLGDFNLEIESEGIKHLLNSMRDAHLLAGKNAFGPAGTFNGFEFHKPVTRRIDFIFVSPEGIQVKRSGILSDSNNCRYPSDHFPVFAELSF